MFSTHASVIYTNNPIALINSTYYCHTENDFDKFLFYVATALEETTKNECHARANPIVVCVVRITFIFSDASSKITNAALALNIEKENLKKEIYESLKYYYSEPVRKYLEGYQDFTERGQATKRKWPQLNENALPPLR